MGLYRVRGENAGAVNVQTNGVLCEHGRLYFTMTPGDAYIQVDGVIHLERLDTPQPVPLALRAQAAPGAWRTQAVPSLGRVELALRAVLARLRHWHVNPFDDPMDRGRRGQ